MAEYVRQDMVWEKEDLLISGCGKYHDYNFYRSLESRLAGRIRVRHSMKLSL